MELHHHLGHIAAENTRKLVTSGAITGVELYSDFQVTDCDVCIYACATHLLVPTIRISPLTQDFDDEIHTNVWGPAPIPTHQGRKYFITFTDDATRYTVTYLLRTKDEALNAYKSFKAWANMQQHCDKIKVLCSDCKGE